MVFLQQIRPLGQHSPHRTPEDIRHFKTNSISIELRPESLCRKALSLDYVVASACVPDSSARAAVLIRTNPLISGQSGVLRVAASAN